MGLGGGKLLRGAEVVDAPGSLLTTECGIGSGCNERFKQSNKTRLQT